MTTSEITKHVLAVDPNGWRINCCSFQQDALMTYGDYQYVVLYKPLVDDEPSGPRITSIGRRNLNSKVWNFVDFTDYIQTKDDGHNVICMGISGDGIIHLAWDMHGDKIHYRQSKKGVTTETTANWAKSSFGPVMTTLGCGEQFEEITYPRFQTLQNGDLLLEFRSGRSGLGDCYIYRFSCQTHDWSEVGMYIKGIGNNAYLHGFDYAEGIIHVSWTYRDYVEDKHGDVTCQAGPNGPENNHDFHYMYSEDDGVSWRNSVGAQLKAPVDIQSDTLVVEIPKGSGIMNQESQCVDRTGLIHVLGRENDRYFHYYRESDGKWNREILGEFRAPLFGARGTILVRQSEIFCLLPAENFQFVILKQKLGSINSKWETVHVLEGLDGEPLVDRYSDKICILQREANEEDENGRSISDDVRHVIMLELPIQIKRLNTD